MDGAWGRGAYGAQQRQLVLGVGAVHAGAGDRARHCATTDS